MDIWIRGYMDIWIYGYMHIWIYGYLDKWMDINDGGIFLWGGGLPPTSSSLPNSAGRCADLLLGIVCELLFAWSSFLSIHSVADPSGRLQHTNAIDPSGPLPDLSSVVDPSGLLPDMSSTKQIHPDCCITCLPTC